MKDTKTVVKPYDHTADDVFQSCGVREQQVRDAVEASRGWGNRMKSQDVECVEKLPGLTERERILVAMIVGETHGMGSLFG